MTRENTGILPADGDGGRSGDINEGAAGGREAAVTARATARGGVDPSSPGHVGSDGAAASRGLSFAGSVRRGSFVLDVAFDLAPGRVLGVLGPNGSGKTTLLRALAGLDHLQTGELRLDGELLDAPDQGVYQDPRERRVGVLFQDYRLFPHLKVRDNVAFGPRSAGVSRAQARQTATAWLERFGLGEYADRKPSQLSGGQAQRVALARALATDPRLLVFDEPLAALDSRTRLDVRTELRDHLADFAGPVVLVTHDPVEAMVMTDELLVIEAGRVVQRGAPAEVAARPLTDYVARLVGLNLYEGTADGTTVRLDRGGTLIFAAEVARGGLASDEGVGQDNESAPTRSDGVGRTLEAGERGAKVGGPTPSEGTADQADRSSQSVRATRPGQAGESGHAVSQPSSRRVFVAVRPEAIAVFADRPGAGSPRNVWPARVRALDVVGERVRLHLGGEPPAIVDVTAAAVAELGLHAGSEVWCAVKATELTVYDA